MINDFMPKTASNTMAHVIALCARLSPNKTPVYLNVEATEGSIENECFENVSKVIKEKGGSIQYGWQIWETLPGLMVEAEFHAVWVDSQGVSHDITPKIFTYISNILFLPDDFLKYNDQQIDNVRISLVDDALIKNYIKVSEEVFLAMNKGELKYYHGEFTPNTEIENLQKQQMLILRDIIKKYYS